LSKDKKQQIPNSKFQSTTNKSTTNNKQIPNPEPVEGKNNPFNPLIRGKTTNNSTKTKSTTNNKQIPNPEPVEGKKIPLIP
jgi:hypothetical protein